MAWGTCRYVPDFPEGHSQHLDEDGVCASCVAVLVTIEGKMASGDLPRVDDSGGFDGPIRQEPKPMNALTDCVACGQRFNGAAQQRAVFFSDNRWRFVHAGRCWTLLRSA